MLINVSCDKTMTFLMTFIDKPAVTEHKNLEVDALGAGSVQEEIADRERVLHLGR